MKRCFASILAATLAATTVACSADSGVTATRSATTGTSAPNTTTTVGSSPPNSTPSTTSPRPSTTAPPFNDEAIPDDPDVRIVTLDNGLTVYLRHNERPGLHAELRLVINAGSAVEEPDQAGVAHFLEHMLFNGTTKYPANELIATLRTFGMDLGADINAYTSYDETVYQLSVPLSDPDNLATGIDVLAEWLSAATLAPDEVTKERGVVLDEWRQRDQSLDGRIGDTITNMFLGGTAYDGRQPIGGDAAINAMTPDLLRRFYDRWYRPDNAAIVVVGDIDVSDTEKAVRDRLGGIASRGGDGPPSNVPLAAYDTPVAQVLADPDEIDAALELTLPTPAGRPEGSVGAAQEELLLGLAFEMISTRFSDDIARGGAPFTSAFPSNNDIVRVLDAPSVVVRGEPGKLNASIDALLNEFERVRRFGFDESELGRAVDRARSNVDEAYDGRNTTQDTTYSNRYVGHFLEGQPIPSAETQRDLITGMLDSVTTSAVGDAFLRQLESSAPHLLVAIPDSLPLPPSSADLLAKIAALDDLDLAPREESVGPESGLMVAPEPVEETKRTTLTIDPFSFLEPVLLTFPNGARVVLNATDIVDESVSFAAVSPGGLSLVDDADVGEALITTDVIESSGVGDLDPVQLDTVLGATSVEVSPYLDQAEEGFGGSSSTGDLEQLFQLVHLYLAAPRFDQAGLDAAIGSIRPLAEDPGSSPDFATYLAYTDARYGGAPRFNPIPADLDSLDLATVEKVWRARFSNVSDWTFALSGDFDMDTVTDLARRYIGSLTGTGTTEAFVDLQPEPPPGVVDRRVAAGTGDKSTLTRAYDAPVVDIKGDGVLCDVLGSVLTTRLTDHVREELGASYSPNAFCAISLEPDVLATTVVQITGDPAGIDQLAVVVEADLESLRRDGATDAELDTALADLRDQYDLFSNELLLSVLVRAPLHPEELEAFIDRRAVLEDVDSTAFKKFVGVTLPAGQYIEIKTVPA